MEIEQEHWLKCVCQQQLLSSCENYGANIELLLAVCVYICYRVQFRGVLPVSRREWNLS